MSRTVIDMRGDTRRGPRRRRAFTIAEMGVSIAVTSLLMVSVGAAMVIAARSLPDPKIAPASTLMGAAALSELGDDLSYAVRVIEQTERTITFTVADRNDPDANVETIRYAWSGVAGEPLTRSYNGSTPVTVVNAVQSLSFTYQARTVTESYEAKSVESAEYELRSYDSTSSLSDMHVHKKDFTGQYFKPNLPSGVKSWSVTRVKYRAQADHEADSTLYVQLRPAKADKRPTLTVLDQASRAESTLGGSTAWYESSFSGTGSAVLEPIQALCIVFMTTPGSPDAARIEYRSGGVPSADAGLLEYGGDEQEVESGWKSVPSDKALRYYAYGKAVAPPAGAANLTATRTYLTGVRCAVNPSAATDSPLDVTFAIANEPEMLETSFDFDGSADPTGIDGNGDGTGDWTLRAGSMLTGSSFAAGVWTLSGTGALDAAAPGTPALRGLTTATVRFRDTTSADGGVSFRLNVDRSNGMVAPIIATLTLQSDGTQKLTLQTIGASGTLSTTYAVSNLPSSMTTVRLMADAAQGTVNLSVNGSEMGTFGYTRRAASLAAAESTAASVSLEAGGSAEVDSVSVRAGGGTMKRRNGVTSRERRRPAAFSMVETVLSVVLVGGVFVAALNTAGAAATARASALSRAQGMLVAQDLMAEIVQQPYDDPNPPSGIVLLGIDLTGLLGLDSGDAVSDGTRSGFDDIDDYNGWNSTPQTKTGVPIDWASRYRVTVNVGCVQLNNPKAASTSETGVKRVIVTVTRGGKQVATLTTYRTRSWGARVEN